jgi:hypothetical protein
MSKEISMQASLQVTNGNDTAPAWFESLQPTQSVVGEAGGVINLTTTFADIPLGSLATVGYCMLKNLDTGNNIDVGIDQSSTFRNVMTLKPGEVAVFRWKSGVVPAAVAQAGTPKLRYWILND